jgi:hypothetical protein
MTTTKTETKTETKLPRTWGPLTRRLYFARCTVAALESQIEHANDSVGGYAIRDGLAVAREDYTRSAEAWMEACRPGVDPVVALQQIEDRIYRYCTTGRE